jgi:hypothetical protein
MTQPSKLYENGVLIRLRAPGWSATIADPRIKEIAAASTGADTHALTGSKYIIPRNLIKDIKSPVDRARRAISSVSIPWSANRVDDRGNRKEDGMWLCPSSELPDLEVILRNCRQDREAALRSFLADYENIIAERRVTLGTLFNDFDYPEKDWIKEKFSWDVDIVPLWSLADVEDDLRLKLPAAWAEEQIEHARKEEAKRIAYAVASVAHEAVDFVEDTASKLNEYQPNDEDGRKGNTFKNKTLYKNVTRLRERMEKVNVMLGDDALHDTISALQAVESTLGGTDPGELRTNPETRKALADALTTAAEKARPATDRLGDLLG